MSDFTHLHVHSHYSLLDGLGRIGPLVERTKELGMDSLAITDHGAMYGVIEFVKTATAAGIKPIIGVEGYLAPKGHQNKRGKIDANPRHLTLLAATNQGYKNLIKLTTHAYLHGYYYKPRIDYELLQAHSDGVIVLSGCLNGDISKAITEKRLTDAEQLIEWHLDVFGRDRFYLEVQDHTNIPEQRILNEGLFHYAEKYQLHLVATADSHYVHREDAEAHDVLICVQTGKKVQDTDRLSMLSDDFSLRSPAELKEVWKEHPAAIENTQRIAELCNVQIEFGKNRLPPFPLPPGETADSLLRQQCLTGLKQRYHDRLPEQAMERLDYELEVIKKTGFSSYFLIVSDFVTEAKNRGILVGPGRGSAAGSFVSYLTNITNLDPLAYNLLFERFLNPERVSMPDIDLDFADDRRGEVIQYVRDKYGHEHVAQIITFGTMAARAAVRDAGRALGLPYTFCDQVAKAIPPMTDFEEALKSAELKALYESDPQARRLIDTARRLEGVCRHASTHAAAVVITDEPITEYVPLQYSSTGDEGNDETVTQYAMYDVEALGLLKIDFLGLKNLTIIQNTINRIKKRFNTDINLDELPLGDERAYQVLQAGQTTGVFQLESAGMKRYLKELKPTEFEDIISMVALYRPGPMDSIPDFIAAKHGQKKISYLHPTLKPILEKTYGVIVTQEQVMQIARDFAGFSVPEADILRKAVGKKIKSLLDEQKEKFITGAIKTSHINEPLAQKVWSFIEPFARYGFPRAHAACYAMVAYQTAYLKARYPAEFMAALLTSDEGDIDRAAIEVTESLSLGLKILPPDINESDETFTVVETAEGDAIRFGLSAIKNVGHNVVAAIIAERHAKGHFKDLADLFARVDSKDFNRKAVESLSRAGAMDTLGERQQILHNTERLLEFTRALHKKHDKGQQGLFGTTVAAPPPRLTLEPISPASKDDRLKWEKELLGMYVSEHPLAEFQTTLKDLVTPMSDIKTIGAQQTVRVAGVTTRVKKIMTKSNQPMLFVELEDMGGSCEVLVFPRTFAKTSELWQNGAALIVEGKLSDKDGETKILTDKVWPLTADTLTTLSPAPRTHPQRSTTSPAASSPLIRLQLPPHFGREQIAQLQQLLASHHSPDGVPVELVVPYQGRYAKLATTYRIDQSGAVLATLRDLIGSNRVVSQT